MLNNVLICFTSRKKYPPDTQYWKWIFNEKKIKKEGVAYRMQYAYIANCNPHSYISLIKVL